MLDDNRVLASLPPALAGSLKPRLHPRQFKAGDVLYSTGQRVEGIYFPRSCAISLVTELSTGEMVETAMIGRDSMVGGSAALDDRKAGDKAVVQVSGGGYVLDVASARQIARESEPFRITVAHHEHLILAQAQQSAACNAVHSIDQRLARWLLRLRDVAGSNDFALTQEFMAQMLGVRRTSVTIAAHGLRQSGILDYRRGGIRILRPGELEQKACECHAIIKARYDSLAVPTAQDLMTR